MKTNINIENFPIIKKGENTGKTSVVMVCTHGNETCGLFALDDILPDLEIESGTVTFCIGNPEALGKRERFVEMNLNRAFKDDELFTPEELQTYEYKRARELRLILDEADALLDVHSSRNIPAQRFVICEKNSFVVSDQLPFDMQVSGFGKYEKGGTDDYMDLNGKIGICAECGQHDDPKSIDKAKETIMSFLIAMGHIKGENKIYKQERIDIVYLYRNTNKDFTLTRPFRDFELIEKDTILGLDGDIEVLAPLKSKILFAHSCKDKTDQECFLLAEVL